MTTTLSITDLKAREIAQGVAGGAFTPNDVLEASLARVAEVDDRVQAWTILDVEGARAQAEALTAEAAAGKLRGPLHGVPVAIKDEFHIAGMPTLMRGDSPPPEAADATCVARLRAAGAIIVGKTTMPINGKMPPTRNPWNLAHTAGGTSSGSGAAVGSRMVPFAIGEQTAGSNLRPAAYNGVSGLKPTYGRISRFGCYPFAWSRDHVGLIGLDMPDIALALSVLAGPDPLDPSAMADPAPSADLNMIAYKPPRIGVVKNFFPERTGEVMQGAVDSAAVRFAAAGATVVDVMLPEEYGLTWSAAAAIGAEGATMNAGKPAAGRMGQRVTELIPATYYIQARRIRTWLTELVSKMYADVDALLMAVAPTPAPRGLESTGDANLLACWSYLGFPAITVNAGLSDENLPLGLQFVGAPKEDYELHATRRLVRGRAGTASGAGGRADARGLDRRLSQGIAEKAQGDRGELDHVCLAVGVAGLEHLDGGVRARDGDGRATGRRTGPPRRWSRQAGLGDAPDGAQPRAHRFGQREQHLRRRALVVDVLLGRDAGERRTGVQRVGDAAAGVVARRARHPEQRRGDQPAAG